MNEKLKKFLNRHKAAEETEKARFLIDLGLYDKVYSPDNVRSKEFPMSERTGNSDEYRYFKIVPIEITDEEYEEVKKYASVPEDPEKEAESRKNPVATALTVMAVMTYVTAFFAGIGSFLFANSPSDSHLVEFWLAGFAGGTMLLGFSEIIKLLTRLTNQRK